MREAIGNLSLSDTDTDLRKISDGYVETVRSDPETLRNEQTRMRL